MELKKMSIVAQFRMNLVEILVSTILTSVLTYVLAVFVFLFAEGTGSIYPENYYEQQIPEIEEYLQRQQKSGMSAGQQEELNKLVQGEDFFYQAVDRQGKFLYGTYEETIFFSEEEMYEKINTTAKVGNHYVYIVPVIDSAGKIDGAVALVYGLRLSVVNSGKAWISIALFCVLSCPFFYMILFTALFSRRFAGNLTKPLRMLEEGARQIERKNLNFEISYAADNELGQLCRAFSSMQEELKKSLSRQWKMEQERTETVEALAHDLKSPLSIIKAYTEAMEDDTEIDQEQSAYLSVIEENIEKSISLVKQMQYTSEITSPDIHIDQNQVDLREFLWKKQKDYEIQAREKQISIQLVFSETLPARIETDKKKLERILDNVVSNSIAYTPLGGRIEIRAEADEECIFYFIEDTGKGFTLKDMEKAMEKFYRGDEARSSEGAHSGLGLYIVWRLSQVLGGSVEIGNRESGGAWVKVWHRWK